MPEVKTGGLVASAPASLANGPEDPFPVILEDVEKIVSQNCPKSGIKYAATPPPPCDLMRYIEQELSDPKISGQSELLNKSLAITGTAQAAYAATISGYMKWRWPQNFHKTVQLVIDSLQKFEKGKSLFSFSMSRGTLQYSTFLLDL